MAKKKPAAKKATGTKKAKAKKKMAKARKPKAAKAKGKPKPHHRPHPHHKKPYRRPWDRLKYRGPEIGAMGPRNETIITVWAPAPAIQDHEIELHFGNEASPYACTLPDPTGGNIRVKIPQGERSGFMKVDLTNHPQFTHVGMFSFWDSRHVQRFCLLPTIPTPPTPPKPSELEIEATLLHIDPDGSGYYPVQIRTYREGKNESAKVQFRSTMKLWVRKGLKGPVHKGGGLPIDTDTAPDGKSVFFLNIGKKKGLLGTIDAVVEEAGHTNIARILLTDTRP